MFWVQFMNKYRHKNLVWRYSESRNGSCVSEGQSINTDCKQERKHCCSALITSFLGLMCLDKTRGLMTDCWCLTSWDWNTFADTNSIHQKYQQLVKATVSWSSLDQLPPSSEPGVASRDERPSRSSEIIFPLFPLSTFDFLASVGGKSVCNQWKMRCAEVSYLSVELPLL